MSSLSTRALTSSVLVALLPIVTAAQTPEDPGQKQRKRRPSPKQIIRMLDLNGDQRLSLEEFALGERAKQLTPESVAALHNKLDYNQDSFINIAELRRANRSQRPSKGLYVRGLLNQIDENKDGSISREEFDRHPRLTQFPLARRDAIYARLDLNKDGILSPLDFREIREKGTETYFERMDVNNDGVLSHTEFQRTEQAQRIIIPALAERWKFLDWNEDGRLSEAELYRKDDWEPYVKPKKPTDLAKPNEPESSTKKDGVQKAESKESQKTGESKE